MIASSRDRPAARRRRPSKRPPRPRATANRLDAGPRRRPHRHVPPHDGQDRPASRDRARTPLDGSTRPRVCRRRQAQGPQRPRRARRRRRTSARGRRQHPLQAAAPTIPLSVLGGDEFICALIDVDVDNAKDRFSDICTSLRLAYPGGSISVGLAELQPGDTLGGLIARATTRSTPDKESHASSAPIPPFRRQPPKLGRDHPGARSSSMRPRVVPGILQDGPTPGVNQRARRTAKSCPSTLAESSPFASAARR